MAAAIPSIRVFIFPSPFDGSWGCRDRGPSSLPAASAGRMAGIGMGGLDFIVPSPRSARRRCETRVRHIFPDAVRDTAVAGPARWPRTHTGPAVGCRTVPAVPDRGKPDTFDRPAPEDFRRPWGACAGIARLPNSRAAWRGGDSPRGRSSEPGRAPPRASARENRTASGTPRAGLTACPARRTRPPENPLLAGASSRSPPRCRPRSSSPRCRLHRSHPRACPRNCADRQSSQPKRSRSGRRTIRRGRHRL